MTAQIGYVLKQYPRLSETFILNEILGLESHGIDVSVYSLRPATEGRFHPALAQVQAPVNYLSTAVDRANFLDSMTNLAELAEGGLTPALAFLERFPAERQARLLLQAIELAASAQRNRVQHLHAHFLTVAAHTCHLAHLLTGISYSVTAHAKDIYRSSIDWQLARTVGEAASAVITVCDANARHLNGRLGSTRIHRIYNGIGPQQPPVSAASRPENHLLGVGRLVPKKGFDLMLRAVAQLRADQRPVRATIVGDGEMDTELRSLADALGLADVVSFVGSCTQDVVAELMREATLLVAPCIVGPDGNQDALPTVLVEALAAGLPAVTTRVAGIPEIVDDGVHGRLTEADPANLAAAVGDLLDNPTLRQSMSIAGPQRHLERFDRAQTTSDLADLLSRFVRVPVPQ